MVGDLRPALSVLLGAVSLVLLIASANLASPRLVIGDGMRIAAGGTILGLLGGLVLSRALTALLFGVTATDPWTYLGVAGLISGVALLACWPPARRATKVDPMIALRCE